MTSWTLFQSTFILRRPRVASFADIIKIETKFNKTTLKNSRKVKRIRNYVLQKPISAFLDIIKVADFR